MQVGRKKSRFLIIIWLHRLLSAVRPSSIIHTCARPWQVGDTHRWQASAFVVCDRSKLSVYDKKRKLTPKTTEQNLIVSQW